MSLTVFERLYKSLYHSNYVKANGFFLAISLFSSSWKLFCPMTKIFLLQLENQKKTFPGLERELYNYHFIFISISNLPAVEGRFVDIVVIVIAASITNWPLIGRLTVFESQIRSDNDEPSSFDKSLVKLELHSVKLPAAAPYVLGSSNPNPSKISSVGRVFLTFCR